MIDAALTTAARSLLVTLAIILALAGCTPSEAPPSLRPAAEAVQRSLPTVQPPVYETRQRYLAPRGPQAEICLRHCTAGYQQCEDGCDLRILTCRQRAENDAIARYNADLRDWYARRGAPGQALDPERRHAEAVDHSRNKPAAWQYQPDYGPCAQACACTPAYDQCFMGCGGRVEAHSVCIANCPDDVSAGR